MNNRVCKKSKFKNFLYRDVKEYNLILLLLIGVLFVSFSGYVSYALFSMNITSSKTIAAGFGDIDYTRTYEYTAANYYTWLAPKTGYYQLEAWGAQGGIGNLGSNRGGYGAYSTGVVSLNKGDILYLYVGQKGVNGGYASAYNGGGLGNWTTAYPTDAGGGGGATHIASEVNLLKDTTSSNVYIVAGGGGGASYYAVGGNGGGYGGQNGGGGYYGKGGNQTTGGGNAVSSSNICGTNNSYGVANFCPGGYGYGGTPTVLYLGCADARYYAGGGGGGYYGGGGGDWSCTLSNAGSGAGGSGYIGNALLLSAGDITKHMTCLGCQTSTAAGSLTNTTNNIASDIPIADTPKLNNGAIRITYLFQSFIMHLSVSSDSNGSLSCTNNTTNTTSSTSLVVSNGDSITCTATPNTDYRLESLKIGNTDYTSGTAFIFNSSTNQTINAIFSLIDDTPPVLTLNNPSNGNFVSAYNGLTLTVDATDLGTGIASFTRNYTSAIPANFTETIISNGKRYAETITAPYFGTLTYTACDYNNNCSTISTVIRIYGCYTVSTSYTSLKCYQGGAYGSGSIIYYYRSYGIFQGSWQLSWGDVIYNKSFDYPGYMWGTGQVVRQSNNAC